MYVVTYLIQHYEGNWPEEVNLAQVALLVSDRAGVEPRSGSWFHNPKHHIVLTPQEHVLLLSQNTQWCK